MRVGEPQSLARQAIEVRCGNAPGRIEGADVAVAKIVRQDQDDVGTGLRGAVGCRCEGEEDGSSDPAHAGILHRSVRASNRPRGNGDRWPALSRRGGPVFCRRF